MILYLNQHEHKLCKFVATDCFSLRNQIGEIPTLAPALKNLLSPLFLCSPRYPPRSASLFLSQYSAPPDRITSCISSLKPIFRVKSDHLQSLVSNLLDPFISSFHPSSASGNSSLSIQKSGDRIATISAETRFIYSTYCPPYILNAARCF